jgi:GST-like protein
MIELHYWPTPNGWKASIMLEECGFPYRMVPVNIGRGEQFTPEFMALMGQHQRMPAIIDDQPLHGRGPVYLSESGAILIYLAEKAGRFLGNDVRGRHETLQWLMWQVSGLGAMAAQNGHFLAYAAERIPYAIERYGKEVRRLYGVLDTQLGQTGSFVAGGLYSIADIAILPWVRIHRAQQVSLKDFPNVQRWYEMVSLRPAVKRGLALGRELRAPVLSEEARQALFGATPAAGSQPEHGAV